MLYTQNCNQDLVNLAFGGWWASSLIASLAIILRKEREGIWPEEEEPLLEEDHSSPVGYKVPNLPEFPIDPTMAVRPSVSCMSLQFEFISGVMMALTMGAGICYLAFTNVDDELTSTQTESSNLFSN